MWDSVFVFALLCVHSSFALILNRKRKLVALLFMSYRCIVTINVLWLVFTVAWVGLQCVIVAFPDHSLLLLNIGKSCQDRLDGIFWICPCFCSNAFVYDLYLLAFGRLLEGICTQQEASPLADQSSCNI